MKLWLLRMIAFDARTRYESLLELEASYRKDLADIERSVMRARQELGMAQGRVQREELARASVA